MIIYVVKPGDDIYSVARRFNVSQEKIISDNQFENPESMVVGQTIVLDIGQMPHTVTSGQSFYSIARLFGISLQQLKDANPEIQSPFRLDVGQVINIPVNSQKLGTIEVNGYAFPNINLDVLEQTLPYLTYLSIFSYEVRPDGSLKPINDDQLIQMALDAGVAPMMVITNIDEDGGFSSDLARTILTDDNVRQQLLDNVETILNEKNYFGLDIDFEYIYPADGDDYDSFLQQAAARMEQQGHILTTAVAPKIRADQPGLLYEAHHYSVHGELADHVIIMTYEWGYSFSEPMAVSPINEMRRVLDYAVTAIPPEKILMGLPNYGYDWTLPIVEGVAAKTISNTAAVQLALKENVAIEFDELSQTPFFNYYDDSGSLHEVWFDDARSMRSKLRLPSIYDLGGVSYWTINRFFPQNWLVLRSMYDVEKVL